MSTRDPRVDAYIARQREFAKPILTYIRAAVHEACPGCEETLKWSMPAFMSNGILCSMAAFKEHASFGFWKHELVLGTPRREAMGSFGRITSVADLPPRPRLLKLIRKAVQLNADGVKPRRRAAPAKKAIAMPADFRGALAANRKARANYDAFPPSHRREYLEWITEAKRADTRSRRIAQAVEWIAAGKPRNWKYL